MGMIWAHCHDPKVMTNWNAILRDKEKLKPVKEKAVVCAVPDTSLVAAQEEWLASWKKENKNM